MAELMRIFVLVTFLSVLRGCCGQRLQRIRFFTNNACSYNTGTQPYYRDFSDSANITTYAGTGAAKFLSYCVFSGAWRVEYAWNIEFNVFNITEGDGCTTCISAGTGTGVNQRYYGVIKHISGKDLTQASFTLYRERDFGGALGTEVEINGYEYTFDETRSFPSYAFSSYSNWTWQVYYLPHFRGNSSCQRPDTGKEVTLYRNNAISIGSIRLGCRNSAQQRYKNAGFLLTIIFALAVPSITVIL